MEYTFAKKLQDAGFPFRPITAGMLVDRPHIDMCPNFDASKGDSFETQCHFFIPTVDEAMEACGDETIRLTYYTSRVSGGERRCVAKIDNGAHNVVKIGKTPLEAVLNLWLAIHS